MEEEKGGEEGETGVRGGNKHKERNNGQTEYKYFKRKVTIPKIMMLA